MSDNHGHDGVKKTGPDASAAALLDVPEIRAAAGALANRAGVSAEKVKIAWGLARLGAGIVRLFRRR